MPDTIWKLDRVTLGRGASPRLADVTLAIRPGVTAVLGYSGAGKTSLLNLLVAFETPTRGSVSATLDGHDAPGRTLAVYWVPQDDGLWPHMTLRQHLLAVAPPDAEPARVADGLLAEFDLAQRANAHPEELSRGERSRLSVARALASGARVLVMDEPLAHVDPTRRARYWDALRSRQAKRGASLVFSTHEPRTALAEARWAVVMRGGRVLGEGAVRELYENPATAELAESLGDSNWLTAEESRRWLGRTEPAARCYRPERLTVEPSEGGHAIVKDARNAGVLAETRLARADTGEERTFVHASAGRSLAAGARVALRVVLCVMAAWFSAAMAGCGSGDDPVLKFSQVNYYAIPNEETKSPGPRSVGAAPNGEVLVLDTAGRVMVFGPDGKYRRHWYMPDYSIGRPEGVCVLKDGRVMVSDTHYHRVVFFDAQGKVVGMLGKLGEKPGEYVEGTGPGEFIYPVAVAQDPGEFLYVAEYGSNDRVQKFTREGKHVVDIGRPGTGSGELQRPSGVAWSNGKVYVADATNNRVQVYHDDGRFIGVLGASDAGATTRPGSPSPATGPRMHFPYDLRFAKDGSLYVIEYGAARLTKFSPEGKVLGRFGTPGAEDGQFKTPWGMAINTAGHIVIADTGNRRLVELVP